MSKPKVLVQLDVDPHASVFDSVVAVDAGVDHLLRHQAIEPQQVQQLIHGAVFTRGPKDLNNTAIFVGGSKVGRAEEVLREVTGSFFGPMRVSVLFDASGANTTAAAAVLKAGGEIDLSDCTATVLGATGPVGQRAVKLLADAGSSVRVGSRSVERAEELCRVVRAGREGAELTPWGTANRGELAAALKGTQVLITAGAAGVQFVPTDLWSDLAGLRVAIDLNAVPPTGIEPIEPNDAGVERDHVQCYGAIGVGGLKMKIHKAAVRALFESNDRVLDVREVYEIGRELV